MLDGGVVAASFGDLVDGTINTEINVTELGGPKGSTPVWTGTAATGRRDGTPDCSCEDWTRGNTQAPGGRHGHADRTDQGWTGFGGFGSRACTAPTALYCFGQ